MIGKPSSLIEPEERLSCTPALRFCREYANASLKLRMRTAIVTRNRDDRVRAYLDLVGLDHQWQALICANEEPMRDKAQLYRHALAVLDLQATQALAFEDSPSGVRAAKRAQVICAAVPNEITRGAAFDEADFVLSSFAEHSLDEILRLAGG